MRATNMRAPARSLAVLLGLATSLALWGRGFAPPALAQDDLRAAAEQAVRANALREKELDLAKGDAFYLVVDPNANTLTMNFRGAVLREFPMLGLEVGRPSVAFVRKASGSGWQGQVFEKGELDPPRPLDRTVIVAPPPTREGTELDLPVPPTPEEKYPVPSRFHVRFEGQVSLEVRTNEADPNLGFFAKLKFGVAHWWHDARSALGGGEADLLRLRLALAPEDAKSLYRALPPAVKLIVLPKTA